MTVLIPGSSVPNNLQFDGQATVVESDVLNIADQVRELNPDLYIVLANPPRPDGKNFIVMENCKDGVVRFVKRYETLDGRVVNDLRYMLGVPFSERVKMLEKENEEFERKQKDEQLEELYERMGRPMWTQLEHDGFVDGRSVSFPKRGVAAPGKARG